MKTILIINDFNYTQGGASTVAIDSANIFSEKGYNVIFFSAVDKEGDFLNKNIQKICTNQEESIKDKNILRGAINGIYNFRASKKLNEVLKTLDPCSTVVHVHGWTKALSSSIYYVLFKNKFRTFVTIHDYFSACPNGGFYNYKTKKQCHLNPMSLKCILCNCDSRNYIIKLYRIIRLFVQNRVVGFTKKMENVIFISDFSENILKEYFSKDANLYKIYNPIELDKNVKINNFLNNEYLLYVGRISDEKGIDVFCENVIKSKFRSIVVGDGPKKVALEKKYPNIEFVGWKKPFEVKEYMRNARCLIFPSKCYETMGLTVVEAMRYKIPIIANKNTAASDFIDDGMNGFLYENDNEIIDLIKRLDELDLKKYDYNMSRFEYDFYSKSLEKIYDCIDDVEE